MRTAIAARQAAELTWGGLQSRDPSFGWLVAPGIGIFSGESLREAYSVEPEDSFRRAFTSSEEGEDWALLVLPNLVESVPTDVSRVPDLKPSLTNVCSIAYARLLFWPSIFYQNWFYVWLSTTSRASG